MESVPHRVLVLAVALGAIGCKREQTPSAPSVRSDPPRAGATADARGATPGSTGGASPAASPTTPSGSPPPAAALDPPAAAAEFRDAAQVLPQGAVGGWRQSGAVIRSTAANLAQIIDGAAELYARYGVRNYA